jgi:hypothetical protein
MYFFMLVENPQRIFAGHARIFCRLPPRSAPHVGHRLKRFIIFAEGNKKHGRESVTLFAIHGI